MGVRVVMVTGDYAITAASIGNQVGILTNAMKYDSFAKFRELKTDRGLLKNAILLNGHEIERVTRGEWKTICETYTEIILSRATPSHKLLCVREFQSSGHSVLMVGDGVNDVPALRQADLGVAMASGSKIASDLSNIVILNNSFGAIYDLLLTGRQAFVNIRKIFLFSMITSIFSQYLSTILTCTIGIPQLYSNLQMTIVSAFTDVLPSLSLFFEKPEPSDLKRSRENLISARLLVQSLLVIGPLTTLLSFMNFFIYFKYYEDLSPSDMISKYFFEEESNASVLAGQTVGFYTIVVIQTFGNLYSIRTKRSSLFKSLPFYKKHCNWYLIFTSVFMCVIVTVLVSFSVRGLVQSIPALFYGLAWASSIFMLFLNEFIKFCQQRPKQCGINL